MTTAPTVDEYTVTLHKVSGHGWEAWRWAVRGPSNVVLFGRPVRDRSLAMGEAYDATTEFAGGGPVNITVSEGRPWT